MTLLLQRCSLLRFFVSLLLLTAAGPLQAQPTGKKPPLEAQAAFSRGKEKMNAQDYAGAQTSFRQAITFSPDYLEAYLLLAAARRAAGDPSFDINRDQYAKVIALAPDYWPVYEAQGKACLEDGRTGCVSYFKELIRLRPRYAPGYTGAGRSILQSGPSADIRARVQTEALPWLRKAIALDKQQAEAWRELGNAFVVVQQPDSALIAFEQAAVLEPKNSAARLLAGNLHYAQREYIDAFIAYTKAMLADPKHAATYSLRGRSEEASGDDATAYEDYNTALGLDPANFLALMGRGRIYRRKEQYSSAVTDFTAAMEAGKRDEKLSARLERATTYRLVSHLEACGEDIGQVYLQIGKYNPLYAAATIEYGRYYEAMKKYNPAKDMYEKALAVQESAEVRAALNRVVAAENDSRNTRSTSTYTPSYSPPVRRRAPTVTTQRCNACKGEGKIYYEKLAVGGGLSSGGSSTYSTVNQYGTKTYSTSSGTGSVTCTACNGKGTVQVTEGDYDEDY